MSNGQMRNTFGWPAGSVRAILGLSVLAMCWMLLGRSLLREPFSDLPRVFVTLQILMLVILASYFSSFGGSIGTHVSTAYPLGLPKGSIRFLLLGGEASLLGVMLYQQVGIKLVQKANAPPLSFLFVLLMAVLVGCFVGGLMLSSVVRGLRGGVLPPWFQDIQGWVALLALGVLGLLLIGEFIINTNLDEQLDMDTLQIVLTGMVGFYFGARS